MRCLAAIFVSLLLVSGAQADSIGEVVWLKNCLKASDNSPRPKKMAAQCVRHVFYVCEFQNEARACAATTMAYMKAETLKILDLVPKAFGDTEITRGFYVNRYEMAAGNRNKMECDETKADFPGCDGLITAFRYQAARGLAKQTGTEIEP